MAREEDHDENDSPKQLGKSRIFTSKSLLITLTGALLEGLFGGLLGYFAEKCHNTAAAFSS